MAMSHTHHAHPVRHATRRPRIRRSLLWLPIAVFVAGVISAGVWVTYLLWPRWPATDMALSAPSLPIIVNGVNFNIPPAAIRNKVQRKPGTQDRIDLVFLWPSLLPPDPAVKTDPVASAKAVDRFFLTIASYGNTLPPIERFNTIYPRYLNTGSGTGDGGLTMRSFLEETPYQGEDLLYDTSNPEHFMARCTRDGAKGMIGICLYEKRVGTADITARFPREWLADWISVKHGLDELMRRLEGTHR